MLAYCRDRDSSDRETQCMCPRYELDCNRGCNAASEQQKFQKPRKETRTRHLPSRVNTCMHSSTERPAPEARASRLLICSKAFEIVNLVPKCMQHEQTACSDNVRTESNNNAQHSPGTETTPSGWAFLSKTFFLAQSVYLYFSQYETCLQILILWFILTVRRSFRFSTRNGKQRQRRKEGGEQNF